MGRMNKNRLKEYWINKLLFPKIFIMDKPGVIISTSSKFFGCGSIKKRSIYHFRKIFYDLLLESVKEFGKEKALDFFYRIGKDLGTGFLVVNKAKRVPDFLLPSVMNSICKIVSYTGSIGFKGLYFLKDGSCVFDKLSIDKYGVNDIFCAGVYSGILSFLSGKNFDVVKSSLDVCSSSGVVISPMKNSKHIPNLNDFILPEEYFNVNIILNCHKTNRPSFSDLLKFGKIKMRNSEIYYENVPIFSTEQSMFDLISQYYFKEGFGDFFKKKVVEISENYIKEIIDENFSPKKNLDKILNLLCAFGWGIPEYNISKDGINIIFACAPISMSPPIYRALIINGFLNFIFSSKYILEENISSLKSSRVKFFYSKF